MTYQEFLQKLSETPRDWKVSWLGSDCIRRGDQCPITAVHGRDRSDFEYPRCAEELCIDEPLAHMIATAADKPSHMLPDDLQQVRMDLLRACGLAPAEPNAAPVPTPAQEAAFLASVRDVIAQSSVKGEVHG